MNITPPFGYGAVIPLEKHHKVLLPALPAGGGAAAPAFAGNLNAMAISFSEFAVAGRDYPVVFATADAGKSYAPLVVLGTADGQNLCVDGDGRWATGAYVPAFVRRYPFCISRIFVDGIAQSERLVCVDRAYVDDAGVPMFGADGVATPAWSERERLLAEYENDLDLTTRMCAAFQRLELFVPFAMQVNRDGAPGPRMEGMFCIDEGRFSALNPASHKALVEKGFAARIYAHLFSLNNFSRLYDRALAREAERKRAART